MTGSSWRAGSTFDPSLPLERAATIPSRWYFDPEVYEAERRQVWGATWHVAGRVEQLTAPGSFVTAEVAGEPLVVLRGEDHVLRGFYNVCRHRAACLAKEAAGQVSRLRCRYHGWTYDLEGRLIGTPEFDGVADFRREEHGLVPVRVATWGKWVWIHLGAHADPLEQFLSPLPDQAQPLELDALRHVARREYDLACNWKVFVDNYLDGGYHVNTVHPGLAGVLDYARYRTEVHTHTSVQISPLRPADYPGEDTVPAVRSGQNAYYWWIYPNFMLNVYAGVMDTNLVLPLGPDRCRVVFDFYFSDAADRLSEPFMAESMAVADQIQQEDIGICEEVQRGLGSRSFCTGRFSVRREAAGYHFHRLLAAQLEQAPTERS